MDPSHVDKRNKMQIYTKREDQESFNLFRNKRSLYYDTRYKKLFDISFALLKILKSSSKIIKNKVRWGMKLLITNAIHRYRIWDRIS